MWLVMYMKAKNRKKFRQCEEYGSAVWGSQKDIEPYMDLNCAENNVILTKTESLTIGKPSIRPETIQGLQVGGRKNSKVYSHFMLHQTCAFCHR